jgi:hypothetical protein
MAERTSHVHDMARRSERMDLDAWLEALEDELRRQAATHADARAALDRLLIEGNSPKPPPSSRRPEAG